MKSLIIENQFEPDEELLEFIEQAPDQVGEVTTVTNALRYNAAHLGSIIAEHDQLLLQSTFTYKEQLETLLTALYEQQFGPRIKRVLCLNLMRKLDEWTRPFKPSKWMKVMRDGVEVPYEDQEHPLRYDWRATSGFADHDKFLAELIDIVQTEKLELYDITHDYRVFAKGKPERLMHRETAEAEGLTRDDLQWVYEHDDKYSVLRVRYDAQLRRFHYEGTEPDPDAYRY